MIRRIYYILILFCSFTLHAQSLRDSSFFINNFYPQKSINSRLDKLLNTYNFSGYLNYTQKFDKFAVDFTEDFQSTFIKTTPKNIKDIQKFSLQTEYTPTKNFSLGVYANNDILSDDRKIGISEASNSSAAFYAKWQPLNQTTLLPFIGYTNNRQIGENDFGYLYGTELMSDYTFEDDFTVETYLKYLNEDILPRRNLDRILDMNLTNSFNESSQNTISAVYSMVSKDYYSLADSITQAEFKITNNLQRRAEINYIVQDRLLLNDLYKNVSFDIRGRVAWREINRNRHYRSLKRISQSLFDVDVNEFRIEFESIANYRSSWLNGSLIILYQERNENHITKQIDDSNVFSSEEISRAYEGKSNLEKQKNNRAVRGSVSLVGSSRLSSSDFINFNFLQNKLRYDTPSELNFDDRDEILTFGKIEYLRKINSLFDAFVNLEASINHVVYIFSERSSNNNYRRVIKFGSGGIYHGKNISSKNTFEVSANYTVYDFQDINPNNKSFSFRQLLFHDSSSVRLSKNIFANFTGHLKYSEQGDFLWNSFSGRPIRDLQEIYLEPKIYLKRNNASFGIGFRYFNLLTYSYRTKKREMESDYRSTGPLSEIDIRLNHRLLLKIYGWYEFINYDVNKKREMVNLNIQMDWQL